MKFADQLDILKRGLMIPYSDGNLGRVRIYVSKEATSYSVLDSALDYILEVAGDEYDAYMPNPDRVAEKVQVAHVFREERLVMAVRSKDDYIELYPLSGDRLIDKVYDSLFDIPLIDFYSPTDNIYF